MGLCFRGHVEFRVERAVVLLSVEQNLIGGIKTGVLLPLHHDGLLPAPEEELQTTGIYSGQGKTRCLQVGVGQAVNAGFTHGYFVVLLVGFDPLVAERLRGSQPHRSGGQ